MSSDPIEVLRRSLQEMLDLRDAGLRSEVLPDRHELDIVRDARAALASLSAPKPESAEAVPAGVYHRLRSIRYNATHGSQDRPLHMRLRLIAEDAQRAIDAYESAPPRPEASAPVGVEVLRDLRDRVLPAALRHHAIGPGYIEEAQDIVSRALAQQPAADTTPSLLRCNWCGAKGEQPSAADVRAIKGMAVSVDVDELFDSEGRRLFGTVTEVMQDDGSPRGVILLVQDWERNWDQQPAAVDEAWPHLCENGDLEMPIEGFGVVRVPAGCDWIAQDKDGEWWAYNGKPDHDGVGCWDVPGLNVYQLTDADTPNPNWRDTLTCVRPESQQGGTPE